MKEQDPSGARARILGHLRRTMISGLIVLVPLVLTYMVLKLLFDLIDKLLRPAITAGLGYALGHEYEVPGLGILALLVLVYLAGLTMATFLGRRAAAFLREALLRVPLVGTVYSSAKQLIESFSGTGKTGFKRVVMLEYPRKGSWTIAFLTAMTSDEAGRPLAIVYVPTAPTPYSGWVAILPLEEVFDTDLTVPDALRLVFSGGIMAPSEIKKMQIAP